MHQEQSNENQEITQRVQTQALKALTDATEQVGSTHYSIGSLNLIARTRRSVIFG